MLSTYLTSCDKNPWAGDDVLLIEPLALPQARLNLKVWDLAKFRTIIEGLKQLNDYFD